MSVVIVGITDTPTAEDAAVQAAELAHRLGASLHLVSATVQKGVTSVGSSSERFTFGNIDLAQQHQAVMKVKLRDDLEITTSVVEGNPAKGLCEEAERVGAEIIVIGSVRTKGVGRILGSVAGDVMKRASCAVYVAQTGS